MAGEDLAHDPRIGRPVRGRRGREVADVVLPASRRVQVEEPHGGRAPVRERVHDAWRRARVRPGAGLELLVAEPNGQRPFEDVERVEQLPVGVRGRAARPRLDRDLGEGEGAGGRLPRRLEDGGRGPDHVGRALALPEDGALAGLLRPVDVDAVERGVLAARARAKEVGKAGVGSVDVEEAGPPAAVAREGVDVPGRHDHRRPGAAEVRLAAERELELALEEEERIRVALVEVGGGARVGRPGVVLDEAELGPRDLDEVDAVLALEPLALTGPADDRLGSLCHLDPRLTLGAPRPTTRFRAYSRDPHPWRADRDESVA